MITLIILLVIAALVLLCACGVGVVLLDPLIACLAIYGIYKLIRKLFD